MKNNKILILAAHPDDETLGCGGVIKKFSMMGADIKVVFFSDGETSRKIVKNKIKSKIEKIDEFNLEYFEIRDEITLEPFGKSNDEGRFRGFICVKVEGVRLIDNLLLD